MALPRLAIVRDVLSVDALTADVEGYARTRGEGCGAVAAFAGIVRATHKGRPVLHLDYEAYEALAVRVFDRIESEILEKSPGSVLGVRHRVGRLHIGETSVVIAVATPHRAEAFQACRYAIERVKQIAPIWKREFFQDGEAWVEGATADPDDEDARREASARACM